MKELSRTARIVALGGAAAIALAGCGSSGSTGSGGSGSSTTAAGTKVPAGSASGAPITIGSFASLNNPLYSTPQLKAGLEASIAAINAAGGVKGHPLKLSFCDSNYDANKELSCTRSLIKDKVSAFVAPSVLADPTGKEYPVMAAAKTADIGGEGLSPAELNSPIAFPISSGIPGWMYGAAKSLIDAGSKKIAILEDTNPGSQFSAGLVAAALKAYGVKATTTVEADPTADPTFSTAAGKLKSSGADGVVLVPSPQNIPKVVGAIKQSGFTGRISSVTADFAPAIIKALGSAGNGILLSSQVALVTDTSNSGVVSFLADMKKYQPKAVIDETTLIAWAATKLFAQIAATASSFDAASILAAASKFAGPADLGVVAPYAIAGKTSPISGYSRIFNATVQTGVVEGGEIKSNGKGFQPAFPTS